jgi:hypothetical protein
MLREAYATNGTPKSDAVLTGTATLQEQVDTGGVLIGEPVDLNPVGEYNCVYPNDPRTGLPTVPWPDTQVVEFVP